MTPARRLLAEGLDTALLLAVVVGSGIMAARLAGGRRISAPYCRISPSSSSVR